MKVEQIYTGCLIEAVYYIEGNGEFAVIDLLRKIRPCRWLPVSRNVLFLMPEAMINW